MLYGVFIIILLLPYFAILEMLVMFIRRPAWVAPLDACPTGDQVTGLTPTGSATLFHSDLTMKYFLWSFFPFRLCKKGRCQFLAKQCAHYWLTTCPAKMWLGKLTRLYMTPLG